MFYEVVIGLGVIFYFFWKYFVNNQSELKELETNEHVNDLKTNENEESLNSRSPLKAQGTKIQDVSLTNTIDKSAHKENDLTRNLSEDKSTFPAPSTLSEKNEYKENLKRVISKTDEIQLLYDLEKYNTPFTPPSPINITQIQDKIVKNDTDINKNKEHIYEHTQKEIITPSILLEQRKEKLLNEKVGKRESPPKERLTEFLEKTILSDDKIQSIIQNLSLDKTDAVKQEKPEAILDYEVKPLPPKDTLVSVNAAKLKDSIDEIANKIKHLNDANTTDKQIEDEDIVNKSEENKPLLARIQKQSGFPIGLNFGSVIGELKNKTKNGGLKPVFKKFDADNLDGAQACSLHIFFTNHSN